MGLVMGRAAPAVQDKKEEKPPDEFEQKAALILMYAPHINWPEKAFEKPDSPFRLGILGKDRFEKRFDRYEGKSIKGHKVQIVRDTDPEKLKDCNLVFVSDSEEKNLEGILETFKGRPILLMGDTEGFGYRGVALNFRSEPTSDGRQFTKLELNPDALERGMLSADSKLKELAGPPKKPK